MSSSRLSLLLLCNVFWSSSYAISKSLMETYSPMEIAFLRFFTAGVPLAIYCAFFRAPGAKRSYYAAWLADLRPLDLRLVTVGLLTFFVSPYCQLMLGERLRARQLVSIALALVGASIVSDLTWDKLRSFSDARLVGNSIFFVSMLSEAAYSAVAKPVLDRRAPVLFLGVAVWVGIALLFSYNMIVDGPARMAGLVPLFQRANPLDFAILAHLGLGCTVFGYLCWMIALTDTPVSVIAVTLYLQPVLGVFWGHLILREAITMSTFTGGALLLLAVWLGSRLRRV
ncbi:MAG: DMT family transporter [Deltaproteobacteria bacterium]|nr:DMT family transporter [Deltaproteobacteria bacterium]